MPTILAFLMRYTAFWMLFIDVIISGFTCDFMCERIRAVLVFSLSIIFSQNTQFLLAVASKMRYAEISLCFFSL